MVVTGSALQAEENADEVAVVVGHWAILNGYPQTSLGLNSGGQNHSQAGVAGEIDQVHGSSAVDDDEADVDDDEIILRGPCHQSSQRLQSMVAYYKSQRICTAQAWEASVASFDTPWKVSGRLSASIGWQKRTLLSLPPTTASLPWFPHGAAFTFGDADRLQPHTDSASHVALILAKKTGELCTQELASMLPPHVLQVEPSHRVLDMCAAPGSKTLQILDDMHRGLPHGEAPSGLLVANDSSLVRLQGLIKRAQRLPRSPLVCTSEAAQNFPVLLSASDGDRFASWTKASLREPQGQFKLKFDRILCDVPCSGDGGVRKSAKNDWSANDGLALHPIQVRILRRGLELLLPGGTLVYSTCSLNPIEDEAVVATALAGSEGAGCVEVSDVAELLGGVPYQVGVSFWRVPHPNFTAGGFECADEASDDGTVERTADTGGDVGSCRPFFDTFSEVPPLLRGGKVKASMFPPSQDGPVCEQLRRCVRVLPNEHMGGFFFAVLKKKSVPEGHRDHAAHRSRGTRGGAAEAASAERLDGQLQGKTENDTQACETDLRTVEDAVCSQAATLEQADRPVAVGGERTAEIASLGHSAERAGLPRSAAPDAPVSETHADESELAARGDQVRTSEFVSALSNELTSQISAGCQVVVLANGSTAIVIGPGNGKYSGLVKIRYPDGSTYHVALNEFRIVEPEGGLESGAAKENRKAANGKCGFSKGGGKAGKEISEPAPRKPGWKGTTTDTSKDNKRNSKPPPRKPGSKLTHGLGRKSGTLAALVDFFGLRCDSARDDESGAAASVANTAGFPWHLLCVGRKEDPTVYMASKALLDLRVPVRFKSAGVCGMPLFRRVDGDADAQRWGNLCPLRPCHEAAPLLARCATRRRLHFDKEAFLLLLQDGRVRLDELTRLQVEGQLGGLESCYHHGREPFSFDVHYTENWRKAFDRVLTERSSLLGLARTDRVDVALLSIVDSRNVKREYGEDIPYDHFPLRVTYDASCDSTSEARLIPGAVVVVFRDTATTDTVNCGAGSGAPIAVIAALGLDGLDVFAERDVRLRISSVVSASL